MKRINFSHILRPPANLNQFFTGTELLVVLKMVRVMNSARFRSLKAMHQHGRTGNVLIEGLEIYYEENADNPCNNKRMGFTVMSGRIPGFYLFCDAWISRRELITTVAHELHRIHFSSVVTSARLAVGDPSRETGNAEEFSIRVAELFQ